MSILVPLLHHHRRQSQSLHHYHRQTRTFIDARIPWVRDRALDHAVEKEKHLLPFLNLKDLLLSPSNPSPSLPLSSIAPHSSSLLLPFRPIRFLRLFPSALLQEFPDPQNPNHPHFRPSPPLLDLHTQELLAYSSTRSDAADRLLRLLMLSPRRRLPLNLVRRLRFDLGLPRDFPQSLLPDFPDYFQLSPSTSKTGELDLELVCYSKDLALSEMEKYAIKTGGYKKGTALAFAMQFTRGFEMEKKVRKWVEEWQRLPYVSPYEDGSRLKPKSDVWEKWVIGMLHEVLSLMVPKKTEKENLVMLGEHLGLPAGFRKMILNYPGIFYLSNKLKTQTIVLREAYRRDLLVEKHPLMGLRYQYIHLMHKGKERSGDGKKKKKSKKKEDRRSVDVYGDEGEEEDEEDDEEEEDDEQNDDISGISDIDDTDDEEEESDDDDDEDENYSSSEKIVSGQGHGVGVKKTEPRRYSPKATRFDKKQPMETNRNEGRNRERSMGERSHGRGNSFRGKRRSTPRRSISS